MFDLFWVSCWTLFLYFCSSPSLIVFSTLLDLLTYSIHVWLTSTLWLSYLVLYLSGHVVRRRIQAILGTNAPHNIAFFFCFVTQGSKIIRVVYLQKARLQHPSWFCPDWCLVLNYLVYSRIHVPAMFAVLLLIHIYSTLPYQANLNWWSRTLVDDIQLRPIYLNSWRL